MSFDALRVARPGIDMRVTCFDCALRACGLFKPVSQSELAFINDMKRDHLTLPAGSEIIRGEQDSAELYTLYSGWAFRFKTLPDGRRQILNFLLPGDLLGLQAAMFDAAQHSIETLTDVELCLLPRRKVVVAHQGGEAEISAQSPELIHLALAIAGDGIGTFQVLDVGADHLGALRLRPSLNWESPNPPRCVVSV